MQTTMVNPDEPHIMQLQISGGGCKRTILVSSKDTFTDLQSIMSSCFVPTYTSHWTFTVTKVVQDPTHGLSRCNNLYTSSMDDFGEFLGESGMMDDEQSPSDDEEIFTDELGVLTKVRKGARCTLRSAQLHTKDEAGLCSVEFEWNNDYQYKWKVVLEERLPMDPQQTLPCCVGGSGVMKCPDRYEVQGRFDKKALNEVL